MNKVESANLILKLYELRREERMREARNWMIGFVPESAADILKAMVDPQTSASYRMVTTYWDMAASFVNHGAIDEEMFIDAGGEYQVVFAKIEPYLEEVRAAMNSPRYLKNLETLIMRMPDAKEILAARRAMIERMIEARRELAKNA